MDTSMTRDLMSQLQGAPIDRIGQQVGLSPDQAQGAIGAALPLLMGALGRNASQPQGADALFGALQRDHAGSGGLGDLLGSVLGGGGKGEAILGHIFGARQGNAARGLGSATGLGQGQSNQLLAILAPIVLGYLAKRMFGGGAQGSSSVLAETLGGEQEAIRQQGDAGGGLLGAVLDRDGDGDTDFSDLAGLAGQVLGGGRR